MAILITGLGYIGAQLAESLLASGERVVAIENYFSTPRAALTALRRRPGLRVIEGSITQPSTYRRAFAEGGISAVVHLAAQPSAHPEAASVRYTEQTNLVGARLAFEAALEHGVERLVLGSSFKVYGDNLPPVVTEVQSYGVVRDLAHLSKIYVEKLAEMYATTRGLRCIAVRLGITYGLGLVMKTDPRFMTVPNRFAQLAVNGRPLTIHPTATHPAGFIHLLDAVAALRAALCLELHEPYLAVNAVTECLTVRQVAEHVAAAAAARGLRVRIEGPATDERGSVEVRSSLPTTLFQAAQPMATSIAAVLEFFQERADQPAAGSQGSAIIR